MTWLEAIVLGVVQGITEFLPISSDGHLQVVQHLFAWLAGREASGADNVFFIVMLHLGTLAAILVYYRRTIAEGWRSLTTGSAEERAWLVRLAVLGFVATLPLVPDALFLKKWIDAAFEGLTWTGAGFLVTAAVLLLTTRLKGKEKGPEATTLVDALVIGLAQAVAPLPGVSRSGLTIAAALMRGFSKTWAVGFSLLIAVPAILGAAVFELRHVGRMRVDAGFAARTIGAAAVAGVVGFAAIAWLVRVVRAGRLWYFSVYLIALGAIILTMAVTRREGPDARRARGLGRPVAAGAAGPGVARAGGGVGGRVGAGAGAGRDRAGPLGPGGGGGAGPDVGRPVARGPRPVG